MHAWSHRRNGFVGAIVLAAVTAGAAGSTAVAQAPEAATSETTEITDYERGLQLFYSGRYEAALPAFETAQEDALANFGRDSREYATALNNLAELHRRMERYDLAEPLFVEALAIEEEELGADHPGLARPLNNLALIYRAEGRYEEAERNLKRSLAILESTLGRRHPDVAGSLNNLARLYETMGLNERAEPLLQRASMVAEDVLGPTHPATRQINANLARVSAALAATPADPALNGANDLADSSETETAATDTAGSNAVVVDAAEIEAFDTDAAETDAPEIGDAPSAATEVADAALENGVAAGIGPPAELVLPETTPAATATVGRVTIPAPDAPVVQPVARPPEPVVAESTPDIEIDEREPAAGSAPGAIVDARPEASMPAAKPLALVNGEAEEEAHPAAEETEVVVEQQMVSVLPLPESRPSGRRWAKLPTGRYAIHLASVRNPISASEEWERLHDALGLPGRIGQLEPERIEVAEEGVFYRVLGGPFASQAEAIDACQLIRDKGDYCAVLGRGD